MRDDTKAHRRTQIEAAAYAILAEKGYAGTSMQGIARAAKASNETLYRWYGDKTGLFRALIEGNAAFVRAHLETSLAEGRDPFQSLQTLGPLLLSLLTGDRAVALNRAAAADPTGQLGKTLTEAGRNEVFPLIITLFARASELGQIGATPPEEAARLYLDLLVGDLQIRRAIGALPALTQTQATLRADQALARAWTLLRS